jgi:hypothetical protein
MQPATERFRGSVGASFFSPGFRFELDKGCYFFTGSKSKGRSKASSQEQGHRSGKEERGKSVSVDARMRASA